MFQRPDYAEHIGDKRLEARVQRRFKREMAQLKDYGFKFYAVCSESAETSRSFFIYMLIMWLFKRHVLDLNFSMQLTWYFPLLLNEVNGCYAIVSVYGVTISSYFVDGSVLISSNSTAFPPELRVKEVPEKNFYWHTFDMPVGMLWYYHRDRLAQMKAEGYILKLPLNFEDFTRIEYRSLEVMLGRQGERK